jgi:two-component system phosphate regulon sensor histidine kinase PhoR
MLMQVLTNLLENSLRFTKEGDSVKVFAKENQGTISIIIVDNGIGIDKEHLPHVFERFYKVERSRSDVGTGLGLAIVKHIIQYLNGEVYINSELGVETRVEIELKKI